MRPWPLRICFEPPTGMEPQSGAATDDQLPAPREPQKSPDSAPSLFTGTNRLKTAGLCPDHTAKQQWDLVRCERSRPGVHTCSSWGLTCVDNLLNDLSHLALQQRVEHLDKENEAGAQEHQGAGQQNEPHGQVRQPCVHEDVVAWRGGSVKQLRAEPPQLVPSPPLLMPS